MEQRTAGLKKGITRAKTPWHLWLVGSLFIFIYANGIYDYFMMLGHHEAYYSSKNYGEQVFEYFTNYPIAPLIFWTLNVFSGLLAPIFLIGRSRLAVLTSLIALISIVCLELITFTFMNRWRVLGPWISLFDIGILILTSGLFFYSRHMKKRGVLR